MTQEEARANLRGILAELYPGEAIARRVASDADLNTERIAFAGTAIDTWHSILREAENTGRVEDLLEVVRREYGISSVLRTAVEAYQRQTVGLRVDELEAALHLLSTEEPEEKPERRSVISQFIFTLSVGIVLSTFPLGLLVVWFDQRLGWALLAAAAIAIVLMSVTVTNLHWYEAVEKMGKTIEGSALGESARAGWDRRSLWEAEHVGYSLILGVLALLAGIGLLIYGLVTAREVSLLSLVLIVLPILIVFMIQAMDDYRKFRYFSQVSQLRSQFESHMETSSDEGASAVTVSSEEYEMLSQIETQQVARKIHQFVSDWPQIQQEYYAVSYSSSLHKYLRELPEEMREVRWVLREVADTLQMDPQPPGTRQTPEYPNGFIINRQGYDVSFVVDHDNKRVNLIAISEMPDEEVNNAS